MAEIFEFCMHYAEDFGRHSPSLFLCGATGLGKTHLSLSIAREAIAKDFAVIYGSTQNLLHELEEEHFGRRPADEGAMQEMLLSCDLLILDDLGAEFSTSFTVAALYNIINSRINAGLPRYYQHKSDANGAGGKIYAADYFTHYRLLHIPDLLRAGYSPVKKVKVLYKKEGTMQDQKIDGGKLLIGGLPARIMRNIGIFIRMCFIKRFMRWASAGPGSVSLILAQAQASCPAGWPAMALVLLGWSLSKNKSFTA